MNNKKKIAVQVLFQKQKTAWLKSWNWGKKRRKKKRNYIREFVL